MDGDVYILVTFFSLKEEINFYWFIYQMKGSKLKIVIWKYFFFVLNHTKNI